MCGRVRVVAVEEEALVHSYDPAALPEVVVEEEQVLGHTLQARAGTGVAGPCLLTTEHVPASNSSGEQTGPP